LYANTDGRFRDNNELIFNLRLLEIFFPEHGHVFIITDRQTPKWLDTKQKVTIVDHSEIMINKKNDIFSSSHIESYIHHVPNLSEHFIYLNDDVFFGAPVKSSWWFKKLKYFFTKEIQHSYKFMQSDKLSPENASILSRNWLKKRYTDYKHINKTFAHAPRPYLKSILFKIEREAPDLFSKVRSTCFRSWKTPPIMVDFVPRWLVYNDCAEIINSEPLYIESSSEDLEKKLQRLKLDFGKVQFFCINDTSDNAEPTDIKFQLIKDTLQQLVPKKSKFEK